MPLVKFISPADPKWLSTLDAFTASLVSDSPVYRYNPRASPDGVRGAEGTFSASSFWDVEALARAGRLDEARLAFEEMLTHANHVGLYAEQIGRAGQQARELPPGADQRRVQPRPWPRRVNHQDLVIDRSPARRRGSVAKGSHGHEGAPGNTRRCEPPVNPAGFTYMSKEESGGIPNEITTCGRK